MENISFDIVFNPYYPDCVIDFTPEKEPEESENIIPFDFEGFDWDDAS